MQSKEYMLMRFNILQMGVDRAKGKNLSESYVFAWDRSVYPINDEGAKWHEPFEDEFDVSKDMMGELIDKLVDIWNSAGNAISFYDLEAIFGVRQPNSNWERWQLISAIRYLYLSGAFTPENFHALVADAGAPSEANNICSPFDPNKDIFFN